MSEINIICVGGLSYRFTGDTIHHWGDVGYNDDILQIEFNNGSYIDFYKHNIICVEFCRDTEEVENE